MLYVDVYVALENCMILFAGMAIGDGLCDPITMTDYGDFLYQIGLIDTNQRTYFKEQGQLAVKYIQQKEWEKAFYVSLKH